MQVEQNHSALIQDSPFRQGRCLRPCSWLKHEILWTGVKSLASTDLMEPWLLTRSLCWMCVHIASWDGLVQQVQAFVILSQVDVACSLFQDTLLYEQYGKHLSCDIITDTSLKLTFLLLRGHAQHHDATTNETFLDNGVYFKSIMDFQSSIQLCSLHSTETALILIFSSQSHLLFDIKSCTDYYLIIVPSHAPRSLQPL